MKTAIGLILMLLLLMGLASAANYIHNGKVISEVTQRESELADSWSKEGDALADQGKYEDAVNAYDVAISTNPQNADTWINKSKALCAQGNYDEAIEACEEALKINPRLAEAWSCKGNALIGLGRYDEAVRAYDEAIKIDPNYCSAWISKGEALFAIGKHNESLEALDQATKIDPQNPLAWFEKGEILYILGMEGDNYLFIGYLLDAGDCFDKALELNLDESTACIAWYHKGNILYITGRDSEAVAAYDEALKINPTQSEIREKKNSVLKDLGQFSEDQVTNSAGKYSEKDQLSRS